MNIPFIDIHTHNPVNSEEIISVPSFFIQDIDLQKDINILFTAGIHPWHATEYSTEQVTTMLDHLTKQPNLIAFGETGLDKACAADYQLQKQLFELHIEYAEKYRKPVIIHAVKSWNELILYFKQTKVSFVLHGYSEGIELTKQLIDLGCYFSLGKSILQNTSRFREAVQIIPPTSLFLETDASTFEIVEIYREASKLMDIPLEELKIQINNNFNNFFLDNKH